MYRFLVLVGILLVVPFASAATSNIGFEGLNKLILSLSNGVIRSIGYMLFTLAVVAFFWGIIQFIWSARQGAEGKGISNGKTFMMWGLIGLFVMFSVWGIIKFAQGVFGIQGENTIIVPDLQFRQGGVTERSVSTVGTPGAGIPSRGSGVEESGNVNNDQTEEASATEKPETSAGTPSSEESERSTPESSVTETEIKMSPNLEIFNEKCGNIIKKAARTEDPKDIQLAESCSCGLWGGTYSNAVCTVSNYGKVYFKGDSAQLEEDISLLTQCVVLSGGLQNKKCIIAGKAYASGDELTPLLFKAACRVNLGGRVDAEGDCVDTKGNQITFNPVQTCAMLGLAYDSSKKECIVSGKSYFKEGELIPFD